MLRDSNLTPYEYEVGAFLVIEYNFSSYDYADQQIKNYTNHSKNNM